MAEKKITNALISVYNKDNLEGIIKRLEELKVRILSTGGTMEFIEGLGVPVEAVENITGYPSVLGGRVKTLHPKIFGGILARRDNPSDHNELSQYEIPTIDLIIVDLYPFEDTVASGASKEEIIEKIDIGGISLIRAAAKNYNDTFIVSSREQYDDVLEILNQGNGETTLEQRKYFATAAFDITSHYDTAIYKYFSIDSSRKSLKLSLRNSKSLRYGENPHQEGTFFGNLDEIFAQLNGKELSYNNLTDVDAAVSLLDEFKGSQTFVIIKHTNACGVANGDSALEAYEKALSCDPVSAFGGILACNCPIDLIAAESINKLFFEILIAPEYSDEALELLKSKKNRILLLQKEPITEPKQLKSLLNGMIEQDKDLKTDTKEDLTISTNTRPGDQEIAGMLFASKIAKHTKSNTIVLARDGQLLASGVGQTSRVDALNQAIAKAKSFNFDLNGAVMASDAFFPFPDCVEIAHEAGITAVIQPGGSVKDQDSIDFCNSKGMSMALTGTRHFKH